MHALLALNNAIGAWYNSTMLYRGLRKQGVLQHAPGWRRMLWQVFAGVVLMTAFLWFVAGDTERWIAMGAWSRIQWMALLVIGGAGLYFGTLYVLGMRVRELRVRPVAMPPPPAPAGD